MAQGILRAELDKRGLSDVEVASAGTSSWHIGNPPDSRAIDIAARHGIDISNQRARQVSPADFENFDLIIAMDADNFADLKSLAPAYCAKKLVMCLDFNPQTSIRDVPDPYYGAADGFDQVMAILKDACHGIADHINASTRAK